MERACRMQQSRTVLQIARSMGKFWVQRPFIEILGFFLDKLTMEFENECKKSNYG